MSIASFADRESRLAIYRQILDLLPAEPAEVVCSIEQLLADCDDEVARAKLVEAKEVAVRCDCAVGLGLIRPILDEPPSALGRPVTVPPLVGKHALHVPNTAPEIAWTGRRDPMIKVQG